ncbi:hypothetical protein AVEN_138807-1 [Araneus ventricosus]|uniref:Uncharacterized protein n=1 Tax=Araneus ventricosus TaxID=182803 RepID=A0A4Y2J475_ARAVE|nr:hypothetical protein AVEN_138807-1 [Araneus ventricosus]
MSLEEAENNLEVPLRFGLISILKVKDLRALRQNRFSDDDEEYRLETLRSDLYKFRAIEDLFFYLELNWSYSSTYDCELYKVGVKGSKTWSLKLKYAFIITDVEAFSVKGNGKLKFLPPLPSRDLGLDEEEVQLYCAISATRVQRCPLREGEDLPLKGQSLVEFETLPSLQHLDYSKNEAVSRFVQSGKIPHFTLDLAIQLFNESDEHKCDALKFLSERYLIANVTSQNYQKLENVLPKYLLYRLRSELSWRKRHRSKNRDFTMRSFCLF